MNDDLYTTAKLREQAARRLDGDSRILRSVGVATNDRDRSVLSFLETAFEPGDLDLPSQFESTALGHAVQSSLLSDAVDDALEHGDSARLAFFSGISDDRLDGSKMRASLTLHEHLENNGAPAFCLGLGNPNTGKTNLIFLLFELWKASNPDGVMVTNCKSLEAPRDQVRYIYSTSDLYETLVDDPSTPKFVFIDEGSTHFDARTNSYEIASQFTPLAKRFAKLGVGVFATIGHTTKDVHPELKRLATLVYYKHGKKEVEFWEGIDDEEFVEPLFEGPVEALESTTLDYKPDDWSPLEFTLEPERLQKQH